MARRGRTLRLAPRPLILVDPEIARLQARLAALHPSDPEQRDEREAIRARLVDLDGRPKPMSEFQ